MSAEDIGGVRSNPCSLALGSFGLVVAAGGVYKCHPRPPHRLSAYAVQYMVHTPLRVPDRGSFLGSKSYPYKPYIEGGRV